MEDRGIACQTCLVNQGVVSLEECMGCNGLVNCNNDYFPKKEVKRKECRDSLYRFNPFTCSKRANNDRNCPETCNQFK